MMHLPTPCSLLDIVQAATEPIVTIDSKQRIVIFNPAAERVFLYSAAQALGASLDILIPARFREAHAGYITQFQNTGISARRMGASVPLWGLKANGEEFPMEASISQARTPSGTYLSVFLRDITERQQVDQALRASRDELTRLSNALLHEREQEKRRIARELHDDIGQKLTSLTIELSQLEASLLSCPESFSQHIRAMRHLIKGSFTSLRRIASDLRPAMLDDLGLAAALEWLTSEFTSRNGIPAEMHVNIGQQPLSALMSTTLFRVAQEALTNIVKHAHATNVRLDLHCTDAHCTLTVQDDGTGATPEHLARMLPKHLGLLGIRERIRLLNGTVTIHTNASNGFKLEVLVPRGQIDSS